MRGQTRGPRGHRGLLKNALRTAGAGAGGGARGPLSGTGGALAKPAGPRVAPYPPTQGGRRGAKAGGPRGRPWDRPRRSGQGPEPHAPAGDRQGPGHGGRRPSLAPGSGARPPARAPLPPQPCAPPRHPPPARSASQRSSPGVWAAARMTFVPRGAAALLLLLLLPCHGRVVASPPPRPGCA